MIYIRRFMDLVSVIIPTYNRANIIKGSIDSVLKQNYTNIEIIIVDDFSSDNTESVVKSIKDSRVNYIRLNENHGACYARNIGIKEAKGKFVSFQDSDDMWRIDKLKTQIDIINKNNLDVVICAFYRYDEYNNVKKYPHNCNTGKISYSELIKNNIASTQCIVAKKECFYDVKFDESLPRLQDWDLILELSKRYNIFYLDKPLVDVYVQSDSIGKSPEKAIVALKILIDKNKEYLIENKKIYSQWLINLGNQMVKVNINPKMEYKQAMKNHLTVKTIILFLLAKTNLIISIYKLFKK